MTDPQPTFLGIPLEIRQIIYNFCYAIPLTSSSYEWTPVSGLEAESASKLVYRKGDGTILQLRRTVTKCQYPKCHLNLSSVCRQLRNEYFPIFAAHHTFSFRDPLIFANEYLSYTPPHRYSEIRHLALRWKISDPICNCEVSGLCPTHTSKTRHVDRDMRNFIKLGKVYPELFSSVESIHFSLEQICLQYTWREKVQFFKDVVLLLKEMDRLDGTSGSAKRNYLLVLDATDHTHLSTVQLKLSVVPDEIWPLLTNMATPHLSSCTNCEVGRPILNSTFVIYQDCERHDIDWNNIGRFVSELQEGRINLRMAKCPGNGDDNYEEEKKIADAYMNTEKNWKVLFDLQNYSLRTMRNAWTDAMVDLNSMQGTRRNSKQQGRKRQAVD